MLPVPCAFQTGDDRFNPLGQRGISPVSNDLSETPGLETTSAANIALGDTVGEDLESAARKTQYLVPDIVFIHVQRQDAEWRCTRHYCAELSVR